jgi:hypothetical protein
MDPAAVIDATVLEVLRRCTTTASRDAGAGVGQRYARAVYHGSIRRQLLLNVSTTPLSLAAAAHTACVSSSAHAIYLFSPASVPCDPTPNPHTTATAPSPTPAPASTLPPPPAPRALLPDDATRALDFCFEGDGVLDRALEAVDAGAVTRLTSPSGASAWAVQSSLMLPPGRRGGEAGGGRPAPSALDAQGACVAVGAWGWVVRGVWVVQAVGWAWRRWSENAHPRHNSLRVPPFPPRRPRLASRSQRHSGRLLHRAARRRRLLHVRRLRHPRAAGGPGGRRCYFTGGGIGSGAGSGAGPGAGSGGRWAG